MKKRTMGATAFVAFVAFGWFFWDSGFFGNGGDSDGSGDVVIDAGEVVDTSPEIPPEDTVAHIPEVTALTVSREQVFAADTVISWEQVDVVIARTLTSAVELTVFVRGTAVEGTVTELRRRLDAAGVPYNIISE